MAKQLLFNQGGGGLSGGTVLWENPNPNSPYANGILVDYIDFSSYSYIGIKWKSEYSLDTLVKETIFKASELTEAFAAGVNGLTFGEFLSGAYTRMRSLFSYQGQTMCSSGFQIYGTTGAVYDTIIIPLQLIGY